MTRDWSVNHFLIQGKNLIALKLVIFGLCIAGDTNKFIYATISLFPTQTLPQNICFSLK